MPYLNTRHCYLQNKENFFCVHEPDFNNAVFTEEKQSFKNSFSQTCDKNWEDVAKSDHCRPIEDDSEKLRIKKYLDLSKRQFRYLKAELKIYQIPIGEKEKFRAIVILRKQNSLDLLFFDPNHHFYLNFRKLKRYPEVGNASCLMRKENCSRFPQCQRLLEKKLRRLISERNKKKKK